MYIGKNFSYILKNLCTYYKFIFSKAVQKILIYELKIYIDLIMNLIIHIITIIIKILFPIGF